jgi:hypothetical protein
VLPLLAACSLGQATKYASDFEDLGVSARAVGMGSAFVAVGADPAALFYNPSATAMMDKTSVMFMHAEDFGGIVTNDFLSVLIPEKQATIGFGLLHNGVSGINLTQLLNPNLPLGVNFVDTTVVGDSTVIDTVQNVPKVIKVVSAADWVGYFNYARSVSKSLMLGGNAKLIYRTTGVSSCFGMGIDFGALYVLAREFNVGLQVQNLTTSPLFWDTKTTESMDPQAVLGLSKGFALSPNHHILISAQAEGNVDGLPLQEDLGAEYSYKNMLFARMGLHRGSFTFGLGGAYKRFFLDYGYETANYSNSSELPATQKVAGGIQF